MKKLFYFLYIFCFQSLFSQSIDRKFAFQKETYPAFMVGYQFLGEAKDKTETWKPETMHAIEITVGKVTDYNTRHGEGNVYYGGADVIIGYKNLLVSPKIGGYVTGMLMLGGELQFQTDFQEIIPRAMPYLGFGGRGFRFFVGYNFRLMKSNNLPINTGHIGITVPLVKLKKKIN